MKVTDLQNCIATSSAVITQPNQLLLNKTGQTNVSCFGLNDGSATVLASQGTSPYNYEWFSDFNLAVPIGQTTPTASALYTGTYYAKVTDFNSCTASLKVDITQPSDLIIFNVTGDAEYCFGSGGVNVTVDGSEVGVNYQLLKNGVNEDAPRAGTGSPIVWPGKLSGTYTVKATNTTTLCWANMNDNAIVVENPLPVVTIFNLDDTYNYQDNPVTVGVSPVGGSLTGRGITSFDNKFHPNLADTIALNHIVYTYTDVKGCTNTTFKDVQVVTTAGRIENLNTIYCWNANRSIIKGYHPDTAINPGSFVISGGIGLENHGNWAYLYPQQLAEGDYQVTYTYNNGITFNVTRSFHIDSVGIARFSQNLLDHYCRTDNAVTILAIDLYPAGGTGTFSGGPNPGFTDNMNNTATLTPSQVFNYGILYNISYIYRSPNGCYSDPVVNSTRVYNLPSVSFNLKSNFNILETPVTLSGNPPNGIFSGVGINGDLFTPSSAGLQSGLTLTYSFTDANGCTNSTSRSTNILQAQGNITNLNPTYCYKDTTILITGDDEGLPGDGIFTSKKLGNLTQVANVAEYPLQLAGSGIDTVKYTYFRDGTPYYIRRKVFIDSITSVNFNIENAYCAEDKLINIFANTEHSPFNSGTGVFSGISGDGFYPNGNILSFNPSLISPGSYPLKYEYTSNYENSGCRLSVIKTVTFNALPVVDFQIADSYIEQQLPVSLTGTPPGGTFSGIGTTGEGILNPPPGSFSITYTYKNPITSCRNQVSKTTTILESNADFTGKDADFKYCYVSEAIDTLTGNSAGGFPGSFSGNGITNIAPNLAIFDPVIAGDGPHPITFSFYTQPDSADIIHITHVLEVDSIGDLSFDILTLDTTFYCANHPEVRINPIKPNIPGNGAFSGPANGFVPSTNAAFFYPSQLGPTISAEAISYTFTSSFSGCQKTISKKIFVYGLDQLDFELKDTFINLELPDTLTGTPWPGVFSGQGIFKSGNEYIFNPITGNTTITYSYHNDSTGCNVSLNKSTQVITSTATFNGQDADRKYCYTEAATDTLTGYPGYGFPGFFYGKGVLNIAPDKALFNPVTAGNGDHIITYEFRTKPDSNEVIRITKTFTVDSIGAIAFDTPKDTTYLCPNGNDVKLYVTDPGGNATRTFNAPATGFIPSSSFIIVSPSQIGTTANYLPITYTYTSNSSQCNKSVMHYIKVHELDMVDFELKDTFINLELPDTLIGIPAGGQFSGIGIQSNGIFSPDPGTYSIVYQYYNDSTLCRNQSTRSARVITSSARFNGKDPDQKYCYSEFAMDTIFGYPGYGFHGTFYGHGITNISPDTAIFNPVVAGNGNHIITYEFRTKPQGREIIRLTKTLTVDSIGTIAFDAPADTTYLCPNGNDIKLYVTDPGGNATRSFNAPSTGFVPSSSFIIISPSQIGTTSNYIPVTYTYTSNLSQCNRSVLHYVKVHQLDPVSYALKDTFINLELPDTLVGYPAGGTFSGIGVQSNGLFNPDPGTYNIVYQYYNDSTFCSNQESHTTRVINSAATFSGLDSDRKYCYTEAATDTLTGNPGYGYPGFFYGQGITNLAPDKALFNPVTAGNGDHIITYEFRTKPDSTEIIRITRTFTVDSIGRIAFDAPADTSYFCPNSNDAKLYVSDPGGNATRTFNAPSTGFVPSSSFIIISPSQIGATSNYIPVTYTYTSNSSQCNRSVVHYVKVHQLNPVSFALKDTFINLELPDTLVGYPAGGTFSGIGVQSNGIFNPDPGTYNIVYQYYNDSTHCSNQENHTTRVINSAATFSGLDADRKYCYSVAATDTLTGNPGYGFAGFFYGKGITNLAPDKALFNPVTAGNGDHIITYEFRTKPDNSEIIRITRTFTVDSIGVIAFDENLPTDTSYFCPNKPQFKIRVIPPSGLSGTNSFTFSNANVFETGSDFVLFNPASVTNTADYIYLNYTFTRPSGCTAVKNAYIKVHDREQVDFDLKDQYINLEISDTLNGSPQGGTFSSNSSTVSINAVTGIFNLPAGTFSISYTYTNDSTKCTYSVTKTSTVISSGAGFTSAGGDFIYCYREDSSRLIGNPGEGYPGWFEGQGIVNTNNDTAFFFPAIAGSGSHTIMYKFYTPDSAKLIRISKIFYVDSLGVLSFNNFPLDTNYYCKSEPQFQIKGKIEYTNLGTSYITGPANGFLALSGGAAMLTPSQMDTSFYHPVKYKFTSEYGCSDSITRSIYIYPLPHVNFQLSKIYNVAGANVQLQGSPPGNFPFAYFQGNNSNTFITQDGLFKPGIAGVGPSFNITYTYTVDSNNCSNSITKTTSIQQAQGELTSSVLIYCYENWNDTLKWSGDNTALNATGIFSGTGITNLTGQNKALFNPVNAGNGPHEITFSYYKYAGTDSALFQIKKNLRVDSLSTVVFTGLNNDYCINQSDIYLQVPSGSPNYSYKFTSTGVGASIFDNGDGSALFQPNVAGLGNIIVTLTYTSLLSNCQKSYSDTTKVNNLPVFDFSINNGCVANPIQFTLHPVTSADSLQSFLWNFGDAGNHTSTLQNPTFTYSNADIGQRNASCMVTTIVGCQQTKNKTIQIDSLPKVDFTWKNECFGSGPVIFTNNSSGTLNGATYLWHFDDGTTASLKDPQHTYNQLNDYQVKLIVTTANLCIDSLSQTIHLRPVISYDPETGYFEDFNNGQSGWFIDLKNSQNPSWEYGIPSQGNIIVSDNPIWCTNLNGNYNYNEKSWVTSPCFNFENSIRPMVTFDMANQTQAGYDGAILQYSSDFGTTWSNIGTVGDGINWYNQDEIFSNPGNQQFSRIGWSQRLFNWSVAKHHLDAVRGKPLVQLRFAFSSDAAGNYEGFAFDNIHITERSRKILFEHFTNNASGAAATYNPVYNTLINKNLFDAIDIQYHTNFPGTDIFNQQNPVPVSVRNIYYGINSVPITVMNGNTKFNYTGNAPVNNDILLNALSESYFKVNLEQQLQSNVLQLNAQIKALKNIPYNNLVLHMVVIEQEITGISGINGENTFESVLKAMLPGPGGTRITGTWNEGETKSFSASWPLANVYNTDNLNYVVFVQNENTKEILQVETTDTSYVTTAVYDFFSKTNMDMLVFPNPAHHEVYVVFNHQTLHDGKLFIFNQSGKLISVSETNKGMMQHEINISDYAPGFYFIRYIDNKGINLVKKLIVE